MLKNLALAAWSLSLLLIVACSSDVDVAGGGSIDPNANRGTVNVSEKSSSSESSLVNDDNGSAASSSSKAKSSPFVEESSSSNDRGSNNLVPDIPPKGDTIVHNDTIVNPSVPDTIYYLARNFSAQCIID